MEIKVSADTGEAVANLGKTEKAVAGVTKQTENLNKAAAATSKGQGALGDSLRKSTEGINKLRGAFMEIWAAIGIGKEIGEAVSAVINKVSESMARHDAKMNQVAVDAIKYQQAMKLAEKGVIGLGGSQERFLKQYDDYVAKISPVTKALEVQAKALERLRFETELALNAITEASRGRGFTLISPDDVERQLDGIKSLATGIENVLGKAFESGGDAERERWVQANEEAVKKVIETYEQYGMEIPKNIRAAMEARGADIDGTKAWVNAQLEEYGRLEEAVKQSRAAEDAATNRTSRAPAQYKEIQDAAIGAAAAAGEFGTSLDRVAEVVVATGGTMTVGTTMMIQYAEATREATQALLDQAVASRALREEQAQALEAVKGWTDYVLTLQQGYESGATSLYNYVTQLAAFKTQLLQLFGGVTGQAKEELQAMIDLIQKLISTAGAGGPVAKGGGFRGQFERDANRRG